MDKKAGGLPGGRRQGKQQGDTGPVGSTYSAHFVIRENKSNTRNQGPGPVDHGGDNARVIGRVNKSRRKTGRLNG